MEDRLLQLYNEELTYLRQAAREFGEENEAVASRLGLNTPTHPDPYVERLLEGVAYLGARVQLKLKDQFPEFSQHLLHAVQPHYLAPTPSMCIVAIEPQDGDPALAEGFPVPRQTELTATLRNQNGATVTFRTGHDVTLLPLKIVEAEYLPTRVSVASYAARAGVAAEAGLRIRFEATAGIPLENIAPAELPLYLAGSEAGPGELYRQMAGETVAVVGGPANSIGDPERWTTLPLPQPHGFEPDCALLPVERRSFSGYRLLTEYFACPERYLFVNLFELGKAFARSSPICDIVLLFRRTSPTLAGAVTASNVRLFATPAINLFEKQLGRVQRAPHEHEHHVVPDRTRPLDFEVYRLLELTGYSRANDNPRTIAPLYAFGSMLYDWSQAIFYTPRLKPRRLAMRERRDRQRPEYWGTETWISLTAPGDASRLDDVYEIAVRALVTNRELPEIMQRGGVSDFQIAGGGPVRAVTILRPPTKPQPPLGLGDAAWRLIGHLAPNYLSLVPDEGEDPSVLRDHLALYGDLGDAQMRRQIDGVQAIRSTSVTRRVPGQDRIALARGAQLRLTLDDSCFEAGQLYLFSSVLDRFLSEFATVNSFTETIFETPREGVFAKWPPRMGRRRNT